jgi:hypothetical protein
MVRRSRPQATCDSRDQELLLYVHGALPPMAKMRTARHVRGCSSCQQRVSSFLAASGAFADTLRGEQLPRWKPPTRGGWIPNTPAAPFIIIGLIGIILFSTTTILRQVQASEPRYLSVESATPPEGVSMCQGKFAKTAAVAPAAAVSSANIRPIAVPAPSVAKAGTKGKSYSCLQCHSSDATARL